MSTELTPIDKLPSMTHEQNQAATQLLRALNKCHSVGLSGGVFDREFCVWRKEVDPSGYGIDFHNVVEATGRSLRTQMYLDGGAGN